MKIWQLTRLLGSLVILIMASGCGTMANNLMYPVPPASYKASQGMRFETSDGLRLAGLHVKSPENPLTVIYSHGNGEDLGMIEKPMRAFQAYGYNVFAYDYRGYGQSEGRPSEAGTYRDLEAAIEAVRDSGVGLSDIVLVGYSLGTGPSVELASRPEMKELRGLVLFAPFTTAFDVAGAVGKVVPGDRYKSIEKIGQVSCPVLIVHGAADRVIPLAHGQRLAKTAKDAGVAVEMLVLKNGNHMNAWDEVGHEFWNTLDRMVGK